MCKLTFSLLPLSLFATIFGNVRGIVHDPDHRPVAQVNITLRALASDYTRTGATDSDGAFEFLRHPGWRVPGECRKTSKLLIPSPLPPPR